jgi:hypothetical protein
LSWHAALLLFVNARGAIVNNFSKQLAKFDELHFVT